MLQALPIPTEVSIAVFTVLISLYAVGRMQELRVGVVDATVVEWTNILNVISVLVPLHTMIIVLFIARRLSVSISVAYDGFSISLYMLSLILAVVMNGVATIVGLKFGTVVHSVTENQL